MHPLFLGQVETLVRQVEALCAKDPVDDAQKNATKRLAAIVRLTFDLIPQDPARTEYRQHSTLGDTHKFFQRCRLFFRYHLESKTLVFT